LLGNGKLRKEARVKEYLTVQKEGNKYFTNKNVIIIEFTKEFSRITSEEFVRDLLHGILKAKVVVVGFNHHFGYNKEGDYRQLWDWQQKYNFEAEEIPEQEVQHETVSSTKIRQAITDGYIQRANAYLDHYYIIMGQINEYVPEGSNDLPAFGEICLTEECKLIPSAGIFAISAETGNRYSRGMSVIQKNSEGIPEILVNLFDDPVFVKNAEYTIAFHKKIHGAVTLSDSRFTGKILQARDEIFDLIY